MSLFNFTGMPQSSPPPFPELSGKELSLEAFADAGFEIPSGEALVDEIVEDKLLLDMLSKALSELTEEERVLIDELFFNDKSEREIAREIGVSQPAIHKRRNRILEN